MRTIKNLNPFNKLTTISLLMTFLSCGSYQGTSYYAVDGIYTSPSFERSKASQETIRNIKNTNKYQKYFKNIADDYSSIDDDQNFIYTDNENNSNETNNDNVQVNSHAPWGSLTSKTEVYIINNNPWNAFYGDNFGFGGLSFGGFHNPYWNPYGLFSGYFGNPLWGLGFYSPFRNFGYGYDNYNPYYRFNNYGFRNYAYNRPYSNYNTNRGYSRYSRSKTPRGGMSSQTVARTNQSNKSATNSIQRSKINTRVSGTNKVFNYNAGRSSQKRVRDSNVTSQASNSSKPNTVRSSSTSTKKISYSTNNGRSSAISKPITTSDKVNSSRNQNYNSRRSSSFPSYNSGRSNGSISRGSTRGKGRSSRGR
jgi:hypothetical protein